jgi:two-component system response regulator YesN
VVVAFNFEPTEASFPPPPTESAHFSEDAYKTEKMQAPFDKCIRLSDMESERDTFIRMNNIFTSAEGNYLAVISAMFKLVLLKISEMVEENALPAGMVEALDSYIRDNCAMDISNTELGAVFGYHPFYISRMLKERRGITLRQYIISYRLKAAKRMLQLTDKSAAEIAEAGGFTDASYFAKSFKSAFGETPKEYRNKFKGDFI